MFKKGTGMTQKKTMRAILAALVATLMVSSATAAFAAAPPEFTDLYVHKYILTDITDSGNPGTGEQTTVPTSAVPVDGVAFDIFRVDTSSGMPEPGKVYRVEGGALVVYDNDMITVLGTYPIALVETIVTGNPAGSGTALRASLPEGLYLVVENATTSNPVDPNGKAVTINLAVSPFIVAVPMTNAAGDDYLDEVHVYPKNEALVINKETGIADGDAVGVGSLVPYTITSSIPNNIENSLKYNVTDQLHSALDLFIPAGGTLYDAVTVSTLPTNDAGLIAGTDYTITYVGRLLTVSFTETGREKLKDYSAVSCSFSATVNQSILTDTDLIVENEATLEFTNENGDEFEADTDDGGPKIHTAAIEVIKMDQAGQALNGAKFKVASSEANAKSGDFLRKDPVSGILYDKGDPEWTALGSGNDFEIAPANVASFVGLKDKVGGVWQSYWIVETVAPAGYNLLASPIQVTFTDNGNNYVVELPVTNKKGFILPSTGGMGTMLFVVGGIVLLGLAVIVLAVPRKKRKGLLD